MNRQLNSTATAPGATLSSRLQDAINELRAAIMAEDATVKGLWVSYEDTDVVGRFLLSGVIVDRSGKALAISHQLRSAATEV